jgi:hypothetical protein
VTTLRTICRPGTPYTPAEATCVESTWRRHGWTPTTEAERRARNGLPPPYDFERPLERDHNVPRMLRRAR